MKRSHILLLSFLPVIGILSWWGWAAMDGDRVPEPTSQVGSLRPQDRRSVNPSQTIARVRMAAQRRLPEISLENQDEITFAEIDPRIDELDVMEVLLEIETEFGIDIPETTINQRIGQEHRRDLRSHLSLSLIAEFVDGILQSPER